MSRHKISGSPWPRFPFVLVIMLAFLIAPCRPQDTKQPAPKQEPPKTGGGSSSGGGVGVGVNVGDVINLFKKHTKIHLAVDQQKVQVGDLILFTTTVKPDARGLVYEYHWSKDKAPGEQEVVANISHAYSEPGDYKATVVVYQAGKKVGTSNEVKITVQQAVAVAKPPVVPPPAQAPPPKQPQPIQPKPAPTTQQPATTAGNATPRVRSPVKKPVEVKPPSQPPVEGSATVPVPTSTTPAPAAVPVVYGLAVYFDPHPQTGKPTGFRAELSPAPPAGTQVQYCFTWGDGDPPSCQSAPTAEHTYRFRGQYLAAVAAYAGTDQLATQGNELAASGPVQIQTLPPLWLKELPLAALVLAVVVAGYGTHKVRKILRGTVRVTPDFGRHVLSAKVPQSGDALRIRCVQGPVRTSIRFTSSG